VHDLGLPHAITAPIGELPWGSAEASASGTTIRRIGQPPRFFLKSGPEDGANPPSLDAEKLAWLRAQGIPAAPVVAFAIADGIGHLLMAALSGRPAAALGSELGSGSVLDALAEAVAGLHARPVSSCPFPADAARKLAEARRRLDAGFVDLSGFDPSNRATTPASLFQRLAETVPVHEDLVVVHGDLTLDNIIVDQGRVTGLVDVGRLGVTDRHCDLALICRSLRKYAPPGADDAFLDRYGRRHVDPARMDWYLLLDEFF